MHQQLGGSPKDTASNMRAILTALADINIVGIAPSFDPPHIRVLLDDEFFGAAYDAMKSAGLEPTVHSAVTITLPDAPSGLRRAIDVLEGMGYVVEALLVLPGCDLEDHTVNVSFGISQATIPDWSDAASEALAADVLANL